MRYPGQAANTHKEHEVCFTLPAMEVDRSDDSKPGYNARSSIAIMNQDSRAAGRLLALHMNDSESEDEDAVFERAKKKHE